MRVHCLQHAPFEGPGSIERWFQTRSVDFAITRLFADDPLPAVDEIDWLIVLGGPMSANDERTHPWLASEKRLIAAAVASARGVLGVCLGAQLIASGLGAPVLASREREIGWFPVHPTPDAARSPFAPVFSGPLDAFHWHGETVALPRRASHLARSAGCEQQAFAIGDRVLGIQFHLETTPASARALIEHCADDLAPGRWVQTGPAMLQDDGRFRRANQVMDAVLDRLHAAIS